MRGWIKIIALDCVVGGVTFIGITWALYSGLSYEGGWWKFPLIVTLIFSGIINIIGLLLSAIEISRQQYVLPFFLATVGSCLLAFIAFCVALSGTDIH